MIPRICGAVVAVMVAVGAVGGASAQQQEAAQLAGELATIPYGAPIKLFQKFIEDRISEEYRPLIKNERSAVKRDQLKRDVPVKIQAVKDTYTAFTGTQTGYDISVLAGEFRQGVGDALMKEGTDRYYLFAGDRLWKVVNTIEPQTDFPTYALKLTTVFGAPEAMEFRDVGGFRPPLRVRWKLEDRVVELADRRAEFGCYTLIVAKSDLWKERLADRMSIQSGGGVSQKVQDITGQGTGGSDVSDIVDQILQKEAPPQPPPQQPAPSDGSLAPR